MLLIRESKFGKSRLVPLHPSSMQALDRYARLRDQLQPQPDEPSFFVSLNRKRLLYAVVQQTFRQLIDTAGIGAGAPSPPRLHDFRHTFAVRTLLGWYRARRGRAGQDPVAVDLPGAPRAVLHLLVPVGRPGTARAGRRPPGHGMVGGAVMTLIAPTLQAFFTDRLAQQRQASPQHHRGLPRHPAAAAHLRAPADRQDARPARLGRPGRRTISAFLNHLETERHNSTRTRNVRLTAIRSLFSYAALRHPEHALLIQRVLAIPPKRFDKRIVTFLTATEVDALLAAPDQARWEGRRDRALMLLAVQTGLRVSELIGLNCGDVTLGTGASVRCEGKGRKQRAVPLTSPAEALLRLLAQRTSRPPRRPAVPDPHRTAAQPRRRRAAGQHPRRGRGTAMPVAAGQEDPPARPAPQLRHVAAASRRRHLRDRALARPRRRPVHRRLRARRHQHQGEEPSHSPPPQTARPGRYRPTDKVLAFLESL